ncbi:MAG: hypothetical protein A3C16_02905 [Candidatus Sungbacteria bacterium RIFCSPHIGHO2_02_FULL_51_29]|uniref:Uncharacterized protein n=1 Tax=Candidatus Sungbacteria bacterium RIFCSPHIGHO2_02_FULL_51_29 TaxID=1802273 RepID=A0A1G2KTV6_9BACT|nr:MAG: hypothetical protein A3C16_02905 [Candidatus Sungbacteria bacterium RIFCSPHIGHO2_02_FULL_51_29]
MEGKASVCVRFVKEYIRVGRHVVRQPLFYLWLLFLTFMASSWMRGLILSALLAILVPALVMLRIWMEAPSGTDTKDKKDA